MKKALSVFFSFFCFYAIYTQATGFPVHPSLVGTFTSVPAPYKPFIFKEKSTETRRYEYSANYMGTGFRIVLYAEQDSLADLASKGAFERIEELENIMSDYLEQSELSRLSASSGTGDLVRVSRDLYKVLTYAQRVSRKSGGAFDVTTGALSRLWRRAFRQKSFPDSSAVRTALGTVGYQRLELYENHFVKLNRNGMRLDLGGIAKGYAIDQAMQVLARYGITSALIDGGGDILVTDPPPGRHYWIVERMAYQNGNQVMEKLYCSNQAVATSGHHFRFMEHEGRRYSHIIDPRTGYGVTKPTLVTVQAPTCMEADAWATALSVGLDSSISNWLLEKQGFTVFLSQRDL